MAEVFRFELTCVFQLTNEYKIWKYMHKYDVRFICKR